MDITRRVLVVGGGIAGLAAALRLTHAGAQVTVVEQAPEFAEIGAGLQLGPNATRLLDAWGLLDGVKATAVVPRALVLRDVHTDTLLARQDLGDRFVERYGGRYLVTHRTDLHTVLLDAARVAGVELVPGTSIDEVIHADDRVVGLATDGRKFAAAALVAADGLHSRQRARLIGDEPQPSGYVAYRGTVPIDEVPGAHGLDEVVCWVGPGCHIVRYPLRGGRLLNQVAVFYAPRAAAERAVDGDPAEIAKAFAMAHPDVLAGLEYVGTEKCWPLADRLPTERWVDRRTLLIGDAAHPMFQYLAQGACQALEDADALGDVVAATQPWDGDGWHDALVEVARRRAPRAARVQTTARTFGEICHVEGIGAALRDAHLRAREGDWFDQLDWLYLARDEQENPVTNRELASADAALSER
ncbi:3-hydroxybenzoate 6-hydroxylase [Cellulomonas chitinilytica]|uniref:3-hydroxybenzoate 6-hydroxylase n=1 Tax=Cellulomonas chitinilytica TaxID=398759 RepID=A0A919P2S2_9CELL|nr:FAD-dependent oxidoreductase [Cellulomonas chitinilytica]GIG21180.1 3-hydroxybenzoate 6-hydroxylase [Cellulomonas chitinilytica]